jgi:hypothetical protein
VTLFDSLLDPADSEAVGAVALAVAGAERDLHEAVQAHYEALDADPPEDGPPVEARAEQLRRLVRHHVEGDLWGYFLEEAAPEGLERPEEARAFAGLDDDAWAEQLDALADAAPEGVGATPRERADAVVRDRFGLDLETFEARIVGWRPERTLRRALRGPIDADIERIRAATAAIEGTE